MSEHPTVEAQRRLQHARAHLKVLDDKIRLFMEREPFGAVSKHNYEQATYIVHGEIRETPPLELGLIAGDVIHNIRASLDNLLWAFACRHHDPPENPNASFPIFKDRTGKNGWDKKGGDLLQSVASSVGLAVTECQPFMRSPNDSSQDLLWVLNRLWNDDKHKRIVPVAGAWVGGRLHGKSFKVTGGSRMEYLTSGPFEPNAELFRMDYNPAGKLEGELVPQFSFNIAFPANGPARGMPMSKLIHGLHDYVMDGVLPRFKGL